MFLLHNFRFIPKDKFSLSYSNRSFQYNDGLFDTLILDKGQVRFLADHLERMQQASQLLQFALPIELHQPDVLQGYILQLAEKTNLLHRLARIKVHVWRSPGGLFTPDQHTVETLVTIQPQAAVSKIIPRVDLAITVHNTYSPLSFFKGPFATQYVLASLEKKQKQLDELILLDAAGHVSECLTANIFWVKENTLYTPALATGCIAGILRKNILQVSAREGIKVEEGIFTLQDLLAAEAIFTSNVTGLRPIQFLQQTEFSTSHSLLNRLQTLVFSN
jgi:branched-chain amino acid aminotransferase/4-amino-4-deoxychorismate lyase